MIDGANALAAVPRRHAAGAAADAVPGDHAGPDRHLAGLRPGLPDEPGQPGQDDADAGVPLLPARVRRRRSGARRGDRVRAVRDHHRADLGPAVPHARQGRRRREQALKATAAGAARRRREDRPSTRPDGDHDDHHPREPPPTTAPAPDGDPARRRPAGSWAASWPTWCWSSSRCVYLYPFLIQIVTSFKTDARRHEQPAGAAARPVHHGRLRPAVRAPTSRCGRSTRCWVVGAASPAGRVFLDSLAGYALARLRFRGRSALFSGDPRGHGGARRRAADPEVPGAQPARHVRHLRRR